MVVIQKQIRCRLNISDVSDQFCPNYRDMRMNQLKKQFVGYCSHGMYITKILEIVRSSNLRTNSKTLSGGMHVDIIAKVEGIAYEIEEIIPYARIEKITNYIAIATSQYASISINIGQVNILKVGDIAPVVVRRAQYNRYTDKISIAAGLLLPVSPAYNLMICDGDQKLEIDAEARELADKIEQCKRQMNGMAPDQKKSASYFQDLLYPSRPNKSSLKLQKLETTPGPSKTNLELKIDNKKLDVVPNNCIVGRGLIFTNCRFSNEDVLGSVYIVQDAKNLQQTPDVWKLADDSAPLLISYGPPIDVYKMLLKIIYMRYVGIIELTQAYPDKQSIIKLSHIWKFYNMNK